MQKPHFLQPPRKIPVDHPINIHFPGTFQFCQKFVVIIFDFLVTQG